MRVEGPLAVVQLLETTLLNLVNFPSLIATNAARMRLAAGKDKTLLEFGLRRAQGPDGGLTASKYSFLGGFDGTSNLLAGKLCGITVKGTHAHSFVMSYSSLSDLGNSTIASSTAPDTEVEFLEVVLKYREKLGFANSNDGELAAFTSFAQAFPKNFLALVDTYDTLASGILNFLCVGAALSELGYKPVGIRLDSGDLAYLSKKVREKFIKTDVALGKEIFRHCLIVASNDINEDVILSLNREGHEIDTYGIGTNLVTCQKQPALGCVFKLVEINGKARIKLSQEVEKLVIPGRKSVFRLYNADDCPLVDLILATTEPAPEVGQRIMCRHPFQGNKRAYVTPSRVKEMLKLVFDGAKEKSQRQVIPTPSLAEARAHCMDELSKMRNDIVRPLNATEYKTSVSQYLFEFMHDIWMNEAPIADLE